MSVQVKKAITKKSYQRDSKGQINNECNHKDDETQLTCGILSVVKKMTSEAVMNVNTEAFTTKCKPLVKLKNGKGRLGFATKQSLHSSVKYFWTDETKMNLVPGEPKRLKKEKNS